tara:strand:- start:1710 stop:2261 length:552 start_codon:yes stop_codon:yes gene_type:complete
MKMYKIFSIFLLINLMSSHIFSQELVIAEERVEPGIILIFEGAIKDTVHPESSNLNESETNVHIEARVNWDSKNIPDGAVPFGFIPYLRISSIIYNENNGLKTFVDLVPHINLIDNFHYARNISLPGKIDDNYTIVFKISPPHKFDLALHNDWLNLYGKNLFENSEFKYKGIDFEEIAKATRN